MTNHNYSRLSPTLWSLLIFRVGKLSANCVARFLIDLPQRPVDLAPSTTADKIGVLHRLDGNTHGFAEFFPVGISPGGLCSPGERRRPGSLFPKQGVRCFFIEEILAKQSPRSGQHATTDKLFHDFTGAAINALYTRIHKGARYAVFAHIAIAAVQLQAGICNAALHLGC